MSITPRHVHTQITAASAVLDSLSRRLPAAVHAARQAIDTPDRVTVEDAGIRSRGDHSDPTYATAVGAMTRSEKITGDFEQQLDSLKLTLALLTTFADRWAPNMGVRIRCGENTPRFLKLQDWYTTPNQRGRIPAHCTEEALSTIRSDGTVSWASHGLCVQDYQAARRAQIALGLIDKGDEWAA